MTASIKYEKGNRHWTVHGDPNASNVFVSYLEPGMPLRIYRIVDPDQLVLVYQQPSRPRATPSA